MKSCYSILLSILAFVTPAFATVTVTKPTNNSTVTSPVQFVASATTTTCTKGVASMGIYVNNKLTYVVDSTSMNYSLALSAGSQQTTVEEWDYCGGATYVLIDLNVVVPAPPTVNITASSSTITAGSSTVLTVSASNATSITVTGSNSTSYTFGATGGTQSVTPAATTTYTAAATGSDGKSSSSTTVTVEPAADLTSISHVIFMLQENHSFDNYFGMLNPYREANGWNVGEDGKTYNVDGIDDKLSTISNENDAGTTYPLFKFKSTCVDDMSSDWLASYGDVNRYDFNTARPIVMDGYVHNAEGYAKSCQSGGGSCAGTFTDTEGQRAMGY